MMQSYSKPILFLYNHSPLLFLNAWYTGATSELFVFVVMYNC